MDEKKDLAEMKRKIENHAILQVAQQQMAENCLDILDQALEDLRTAKPDERSELARRYAVTITELEKVIAYFVMYVVNTE
jgi:DNA-binding GntR family transcriptional regulator